MVVSAADTTSKTEAASAAAAASPAIAPTSSAPAKPAGASTPHTDHALHGRALALVFFGLLLAMFISSLSETIASTALPTIVGDLNGVEIMQWVSTAYILSSTLVMPIYGKLGDLIGRKRLLMAALTLYAAGKVVCGLAMNMEMLISGRLVSGLGGGGLSSYPRRRSPTWCRRANSAPTWASSALCSPCRMCWARLWAAGSSR